jgi:hypothetical protein
VIDYRASNWLTGQAVIQPGEAAATDGPFVCLAASALLAPNGRDKLACGLRGIVPKQSLLHVQPSCRPAIVGRRLREIERHFRHGFALHRPVGVQPQERLVAEHQCVFALQRGFEPSRPSTTPMTQLPKDAADRKRGSMAGRARFSRGPRRSSIWPSCNRRWNPGTATWILPCSSAPPDTAEATASEPDRTRMDCRWLLAPMWRTTKTAAGRFGSRFLTTVRNARLRRRLSHLSRQCRVWRVSLLPCSGVLTICLRQRAIIGGVAING